jgi:hypothetical protein
MKKTDIVVGGTYSDGKKGIRRVLAEGPAYRLYDSQGDTDCLLYEHVAGKAPSYPRGKSPRGLPTLHCTRESFATWARRRLDVDGQALPLPAPPGKRTAARPSPPPAGHDDDLDVDDEFSTTNKPGIGCLAPDAFDVD